jgi:hypothetical protein
MIGSMTHITNNPNLSREGKGKEKQERVKRIYSANIKRSR